MSTHVHACSQPQLTSESDWQRVCGRDNRSKAQLSRLNIVNGTDHSKAELGTTMFITIAESQVEAR